MAFDFHPSRLEEKGKNFDKIILWHFFCVFDVKKTVPEPYNTISDDKQKNADGWVSTVYSTRIVAGLNENRCWPNEHDKFRGGRHVNQFDGKVPTVEPVEAPFLFHLMILSHFLSLPLQFLIHGNPWPFILSVVFHQSEEFLLLTEYWFSRIVEYEPNIEENFSMARENRPSSLKSQH